MKRNIFEPRVNILPYEYPQLLAYKDAIRHSYWIDTEYNFTTDIDDFRVKVTDEEREVIKRTMLAIAQIEVNVKTFWADLYKRMPITEIGDVGMTFAESEVRHKDAYARLLRILGLEEEFRTVIEIPAIEGRIKYLKKYLDGSRSKDNKMYTKSVLLFSLFIEHVSLFSQFLIMMSFNKEKNLFKGISNVVEATSKEEDIHGNFGAELVSVFSYYAHIGYLAEAGGRIRGTNGNNSYGDFGSVAEGVDPDETPVTAVVDNQTQYSATISNVFTDNNQLLGFEFNHAGNDYTEAVIDIFGAGTGDVVVADEFRDNAVINVKVDLETVIPPATPAPLGGSGYVRVSNVAQSGTTTSVFLSATDGALSTAYVGMKVYIIGGAGIGNYGIISTYDAGSKEAEVIRESNGAAGWDHVIPGTTIVAPNSSSTYLIEPAISFTAPPKTTTATTISSSNYANAHYFETSAQYTAVTTTGGAGTGLTFNITRNGERYYLTTNSAGSNYVRGNTITIAGTSVGGASPANDITVIITSINSVTGAVVNYDFTGLARKGLFLAIPNSGTGAQKSIDGVTWSAEVLPASASSYKNIASGLINDGSSTFKQSVVIVTATRQSCLLNSISTYTTACYCWPRYICVCVKS